MRRCTMIHWNGLRALRAACLMAGLTVAAAALAGGLAVDDSGVGTAVADRELEGRADRFDEGTKVAFWTRVSGGEPGDRIVHVWMREGEEVFSVELEAGGAGWRTWSTKTLFPGSAGRWVVEARDVQGQVLARHEFNCAPADGA